MIQSPGRRISGVPRPSLAAATAAVLVLLAIPGASPRLAAQGGGQAAGGTGNWVTAWATSQQTLGQATISNASVRLIARVTVPGDAIRVRLDNTFGTEPLRVGRAHVGYRVQGAAVAIGSSRPLTFNQAAEVTVPPGGTVWSDPVTLPVYAQQDLAISLYVPDASVRPSQHSGAYATSYRSADGSGDGYLQINDASGTPMLEAGVQDNGLGTVRAGPQFECIHRLSGGIQRLPDCIRGKKQ